LLTFYRSNIGYADVTARTQIGEWGVRLGQAIYFLDFALFCKNGRIDVETDGDTWHLSRERVPLDNARDNALQIERWTVLRYNTR